LSAPTSESALPNSTPPGDPLPLTPAPEAIRDELARVLDSDEFGASARLREMLRYLVEESLAGRGTKLKGYRIAVDVFGRGADFDADADPLVRIQAGRLRRALERYYGAAGAANRLRIAVPKGGYAPTFTAVGAPVALRDASAPKREAPPVRPAAAVAVLPFQSLSSDPEQGYFAEGVAAELTLALTRFDGMAVIARQSSLQYRDELPDLPRIGRELGARYLVLGSVQRLGSALRIDVSLVEAASQEVLWSERYGFDLAERDLFAVQDDIARQVSARVAGRYGVVFRDLGRDTQGRRPALPAAYDALLRFHHYVAERSPGAERRARAALEEAVALDPSFALGWAMLAEMLVHAYASDPDAPVDTLDRALGMAARAVEQEPACQQAHWSLAWVRFFRRDLEGFRSELERAIAQNPNAPYFVGVAGWALALSGEWERGLALLDRGIALNPSYPRWFHFAHYADRLRNGDHAGALAQAARMGPPESPRVLALTAAALVRLGRRDEARAKAAELAAGEPGFRRLGPRILQSYLLDDALREQVLASLAEAGIALD
jgi:adenylate cyclase